MKEKKISKKEAREILNDITLEDSKGLAQRYAKGRKMKDEKILKMSKEQRKKQREYYQRPEVKKRIREYKNNNYVSIPTSSGGKEYIYTNGVTEKIKKQIPRLMNNVAKKMLRQKSG